MSVVRLDINSWVACTVGIRSMCCRHTGRPVRKIKKKGRKKERRKKHFDDLLHGTTLV